MWRVDMGWLKVPGNNFSMIFASNSVIKQKRFKLINKS